MNTKDLIIKELEETPEPILNEILDFVRFLKVKQIQEDRPIAEKSNEPNNYDFSDLEGKLSWQGDAVAAQRKLRDDEW